MQFSISDSLYTITLMQYIWRLKKERPITRQEEYEIALSLFNDGLWSKSKCIEKIITEYYLDMQK